jgi:hypothetical protein
VNKSFPEQHKLIVQAKYNQFSRIPVPLLNVLVKYTKIRRNFVLYIHFHLFDFLCFSLGSGMVLNCELLNLLVQNMIS